jgi:hypothetical protein
VSAAAEYRAVPAVDPSCRQGDTVACRHRRQSERCAEQESRNSHCDSIDNKNGEHGSLTGQYSIRNPRGIYGEERVSDFSACNVSAKHPPMITDRDGHEYGTLTVNWNDSERRQHPAIHHWLSQEVCAGVYKP